MPQRLMTSVPAAVLMILIGLLPGDSASSRGDTPNPGPDTGAVVALVNASSPAENLFNGQFCGGVLVSPTLVLTAAHCVRGRRPASVDAVVGADNLCRGAPVPGQRLHVRTVILHPRTPQGRAVDAALLVLAGKATAAPARLPDASDRLPATGTEFGWGRDGYGGVAPCRRTSVPLRFVPGERCARAQRNLDIAPDPARQLCAVPTAEATRNTCTGDSGSPVLAANRVWGLVSWGPSCRIDDVGAYVRGASLRLWVTGIDAIHSTRRAPAEGTAGNTRGAV
ncbi:trypsin-like serine protease [Streptomyces prunicolor]|uniref:S1 family peptidase n=1 Tax=Streptomyces prunicolor TaxID=67348 RepID=UPI002255CED7|nr:trypsin-like serine protease [Streptomyces prunicolor]MCX5234876.1 trypsin-like serine protease [Streptomyces prunicolor]